MKIFISGGITGCPDYKDYFAKAEQILQKMGATVMNPAVLPEGFEWGDYMRITIAMLKPCDAIALLPGWENSKGAQCEYDLSITTGKAIFEFTSLESLDNYLLVARIFAPNKNNH